MFYFLRREGTGQTGLQEIVGYMKQKAEIILSTKQNGAQAAQEDTILKWGTTAYMHHIRGAKVLNESPAVMVAANKREARLKFQQGGVAVPESFAVEDFLNDVKQGKIIAKPGDKFVMRPFKHAMGHFMRVGNAAYIMLHSKKNAYKHGYVSRFIEKTKEYRILVVSGKVVAVAIKLPEDPNAAAWNHAAGATFYNIRWDEWPLKVCEQAIKATKITGLDFGAVDVIEDADKNPYVLEVNTAPAVDSEYRQQCLAKAFDYIVENNGDWIETGEVNGWRDVVHPAIWYKGRKKAEAQAKAA